MSLVEACVIRARRSTTISDDLRQKFAQHLTPLETAKLATSMFDPPPAGARALDLGAGTGMLSAALVDRFPDVVELVAVESDREVIPYLDDTLSTLAPPSRVIVGDALSAEVQRNLSGFDLAILNPPYGKLGAKDPRQSLLPTHVPNLYAAFILIAAQTLNPGGQLVAIVPRSWMNGTYFAPFRTALLSTMSLDSIHIYGRRDAVFKDSSVLQEVMLVKLSRRAQAETIVVSTSTDHVGTVTRATHPASHLIHREFVSIEPHPQPSDGLSHTLKDLGLTPSTGRVVDFRNRECLRMDNGQFPLIYPVNFKNGGILHPVFGKKAQYFTLAKEEDRRLLVDPGVYLLVKRFSAKEERRRVVAAVLDTPTSIAIENHVNVIHAGRTGRTVTPLPLITAQGLSLWLNSTRFDELFRAVSGSTQVNAGDLKTLPMPSPERVAQLGVCYRAGMDQEEIDACIQGVFHVC